MKRWIFFFLVMPISAHASCSGVPGCDDRADLAVVSASATCTKEDGTDIAFTGLVEGICPAMKLSGFYTCYLDAEKKNIWTEVTCIDGKQAGLSTMHVAHRWLWIYRQTGPDQRERIADVALPAPEEITPK